MSDRLKYSLNGVYRCENFAEHARQNNFPRVPIGSAGGLDGWYITLQTSNQNNQPPVYPFIFCYHKPTLLLRRFFRVIKKDESSCFEKEGCFLTASDQGPSGFFMEVPALLNEDNGYLDDNGALTVEYGIHVDAILGNDGIWKFNFHDTIFNGEHELLAWSRREREMYLHKQFADHFSFQIFGKFPRNTVEDCFQILHGVRVQFEFAPWSVIRVAHANKSRNVLQYCDQQLIKMIPTPYFLCVHPQFVEKTIKGGLSKRK